MTSYFSPYFEYLNGKVHNYFEIFCGVICGRPLLYWHEAGCAWGWHYSPYSDTLYLSELFVLGPDTGMRSSFPRSQSRWGCRRVNIVMPPSPSWVWVISGSGGSGIGTIIQFSRVILSSSCFFVTLEMTNNAAVRRWVKSDHWVWIGQSILTIYFAFKMITNWEFLHWTFWFSTMYFSNLNQI